MRLEARPEVSRTMQIAAPFAAIAFTLVVCSLLVAWAGVPVGGAYLLLLEGAAGSGFAVSETLTRATPLILTGLAVAVAFRAKLYNIGAEGQLYVGALAAVAVGNAGLPLPPVVLFPLMVARGDGRGRAAAPRSGAAQDAVPRRRSGHDAAAQFHRAAVRVDAARRTDEGSRRRWAGRSRSPFPPSSSCRKLAERSRVHSGLLIALGARGARLDRSTASPRSASRCAPSAPMRAPRRSPACRCSAVVVKTALLSGALAGLAGCIEVAGRAGYVTLDMSPGYGYSGIVIAMLAQLNPIGVVAAAIFVAGILVGADSMSRAIAVPTYIADVIVAASLIAMLVATMLARYRIRWRRCTLPGGRHPGTAAD